MLSQTERLQRLVTQLLDLSRLESGGSPLHPSLFSVGRPPHPGRRRGPRSTPATSSTRSRVVPDDLEVVGDPERLHQVVANLVENAAALLARATARWCCAATQFPGPHVIEVLDDGPGIDEADSERVFERFYRPDAARTSDDGGAGLGLAIARWIVELHGGTIRAESRRPHGARTRGRAAGTSMPTPASRSRNGMLDRTGQGDPAPRRSLLAVARDARSDPHRRLR